MGVSVSEEERTW